MAQQRKKHTRVQLRMVTAELEAFGVLDFQVVEKKSHIQIRWGGGSVALSGTPSDRRALAALRADVRRQCKAPDEGLHGHRRTGYSRNG